MQSLTKKRKIKKIIKLSSFEILPNLVKYYPINSQKNLQQFWETYFPLVETSLNYYGYFLDDNNLCLDHLGLQVNDKKEFVLCHKKLIKIAILLSEEVVNGRWCSIYKFKNPPIIAGKFFVPRIEIYNPMPKQDIREIKSGIEHIAFTVRDYILFRKEWIGKNLPVLYEKKIDTSKFFKTPFLNGLLIEFRNDELGEWG